MSKKIIIAGGGTGGHIFPAVAVANALKKLEPSIEILFVGAKGKMEMDKVPQAGYEISGLDIAGFNRSSLIKNIWLPFKLIKSFFQVRSIFKSFKPDAVFGVGGYSSFPVLRLAQARGIPSFLHESNAFPGKSNLMLAKNATKVFVSVEGMEKYFPADKVVVTGNPVRNAIANNSINPTTAKALFGLKPDTLTVMAMGGSLGARSINEAVDNGLDALQQKGLQLIWQTGKLYVEQARKATEKRPGIWTNDFITEMENAYSAADIIISRSGAMSVAELCHAGKPAVLVPFPFAAEDHQTFNAKALADRQAGILVKDSEAKNTLIKEVLLLASDPQKRLQMSVNIKKMAVKDADIKVASQILEILK